MTTYNPGELRLAVMGDLLRNPGTDLKGIRQRLDIQDRSTIRITVNRLVERDLVRPIATGFVLGRAGIEHLARVRRMVSV